MRTLRQWTKAVGRYIPKDSVVINHPDNLGIVYSYGDPIECGTVSGKPVVGAIAYHGKANKPDWHHTFKSDEQRQKHIEEWFASLTKSAECKKEWREQRKLQRNQPIPPNSGLSPDCDHPNLQQIGDCLYCPKCENSHSVDVVQTATILREELRKAFPDTKFSVRSDSYSGGSAIDVRYTDGPPEDAVNAIAGQFAGADFDGMQDLKTYHRSVWNGRVVHWGADYVHVYRDTGSAHEKVEAMLREKIHYHETTAHYLPRENAWKILRKWDARHETLERAVERYMCENVAGYVRV